MISEELRGLAGVPPGIFHHAGQHAGLRTGELAPTGKKGAEGKTSGKC